MPIIAAEVAINDNIIFNVSPTIGDHVACADITLVGTLGLAGHASAAPACPTRSFDALGDPIAAVPVGGIVLP